EYRARPMRSPGARDRNVPGWQSTGGGHCVPRVAMFFFSSRRRHTRSYGDWSSDVCSSDLHRGIRAADDMVVMPLQCGTQWDGLGHVFCGYSRWNGYDCREVTSNGAQKCGIEKTKARMVGRGVFLDVPRALGKEVLEDGYAITSADLDRTARAQKVELKRGDFVVV